MDFGKEESKFNIPNESNLGMDYNSSTTTNNWLQQSSGINNGGLESSSENMLNTSPLSNSSNGGNVEMRSNDSGDAEGVWSPDIDQAFHEALQIYPPCGRRKIILSDEGKMYGRNELIARYIKIRCGKTRTRKQVSSHIQVLARKKQREEQARIKAHREGNNLTDASNLLANNPTNSANGSISPMVPHGSDEVGGNHSAEMELFQTTPAAADLDPAKPLANLITSVNRNQITSMQAQMLKAASAITMGANPSWPYNLQANNLLGLNNQLNSSQLFMANGTPLNSVQTEGLTASTSTVLNNLIASSRLSLIEFSAYITKNLKAEEGRDGFDKTEIVHISKISDAPLERISIDLIQSKYPPILQELFKKGPADAFFLAKCWANMNFDNSDEQNSLFAVDSFYESADKFDITVSTKVCSFGNEVVEKVEVYSPINDDVDEKSATGNVWQFKLNRSPMCEYMVRFISELKKLTEPALMNSVLENFTVLQIVTNKMTDETLMVLAFIFDIREDGEDEIYTNVYRLTDESN